MLEVQPYPPPIDGRTSSTTLTVTSCAIGNCTPSRQITVINLQNSLPQHGDTNVSRPFSRASRPHLRALCRIEDGCVYNFESGKLRVGKGTIDLAFMLVAEEMSEVALETNTATSQPIYREDMSKRAHYYDD